MITLESLRCFRAVVEEGSFRAAAERLHRSQPAVSHRIKSLERDARQVLIDRPTGRPTRAGRLLYERACRLLSDAEGLERELADAGKSGTEELRVGTSDTVALYVLPAVVRAFIARMPKTRLTLVNRPTDALAEQVARGSLDIGIVALPASNPDLESEVLFRQQLVLVVPRRHRLAAKRPIRWKDLVAEPLLMLDPTTRTGSVLRSHFAKIGFAPRVALDSGSFEVIKRYVAEGIGISFLPRIAVSNSDKLQIAALPGVPAVPIGVIRRRRAYQTRAEREFTRILRALAQNSRN